MDTTEDLARHLHPVCRSAFNALECRAPRTIDSGQAKHPRSSIEPRPILFDAVAAPTRATVAYPADKNFEDVYPGFSGGPPLIPAGNLCGLPAIAVPNGFGENRLPTSLSFMGPAFSERNLIALGHAVQERSDFHRRRPPGA